MLLFVLIHFTLFQRQMEPARNKTKYPSNTRLVKVTKNHELDSRIYRGFILKNNE